VNTPLQHALADYLKKGVDVEQIRSKYEEKRRMVEDYLKNSPYEPIETKGTYFQLLKYDKISNSKDTDFVSELLEKGVALFPLSFYYHDFVDNKVVGLNFAHPDEHLKRGLEILTK
jgi:methionine aminotransferase